MPFTPIDALVSRGQETILSHYSPFAGNFQTLSLDVPLPPHRFYVTEAQNKNSTSRAPSTIASTTTSTKTSTLW